MRRHADCTFPFPCTFRLFLGLAALSLSTFTASVLGGDLAVVAMHPARHAMNAPLATPISITFGQPVERASVTRQNFRVFGRWSGAAEGTFSFSNDDRTVTLTPQRRWSAGEQVMVNLSRDLRAADGSPLRASGYSYLFWTKAARASMSFTQIGVLNTRTIPSQTSRAYGGIATDLDRDGWLDITIVNEDTADLRVFMNRADGSGLFHPFLQPTFPVNVRASPSEPADFNNDGLADICVANINANTVSVLLGIGDGRFAPQQQIAVGAAPRGIAVLDLEGDGDIDVANTNASGNTVSFMRNNGIGLFGQANHFEGGGNGEWALSAGDMDEDGRLDLIIGAQNSNTVIVQRSNGDATFTQTANRNCGGRVWMIACADLNGDGHLDVATANGTSNTAAVLLGDGLGGLGPAQVFTIDPFALAADLGDLDGDGDADWMTASYNGDWRLFLNNGSGVFTFNREFDAPQAASCALFLDLDNDRDLDLALIDEEADVVLLMRNGGINPPGDLNGDCAVNQADLGILLATFGTAGGAAGDLDDDGDTDQADLGVLLANWGRTCP